MATIRIIISKRQLEELINCGEIIVSMDTVDNKVSETKPNHDPTFFEFIKQWIDQLKQLGNLRTAETYQAAYNKFSQFRGGTDLYLPDITGIMMEEFQSYLRSQQLTMNTVSYFLRVLRSLYHKGVKQGLTVDHQPFRDVYTGTPLTQKRALSLDMIQRIKRLQLVNQRQLFARDMFMLSFYLRGMSFIDMAHLKRTDIKDGRLYYKRHKTGQMLNIQWERQMQEIIDKYPNTKTSYLLPIITKDNGKERNQYRYILTCINLDLKEIARLVNINVNLTMYCARHSWATIARELQVPMNVISRAMGHANEHTTEIYIRSIDVSVVDTANRQLLRMVEQGV